MANRTGNIIYNNYCRFTGEAFNAKVLPVNKPDGTPYTDADVDNCFLFKNTVGNGGGYSLRLLVGDGIDVRYAGALADGDKVAGTGTDNTPFVQIAANAVIKYYRGGTLLFKPQSSGSYRVEGPVYINAPANVPVDVSSRLGKTSASAAGISGATLFRTGDTGFMFVVNLNPDGSVFSAPNQQYQGLSVSGLVFSTIGATNSAFNMFRTRCAMRNVTFEEFDYGVFQPNSDINNVQNYSDQSIFENINFFNPRLSGFRLVKSDVSTIRNIYFEGDKHPYTRGIEIIDTDGCSIENVLQWWASPITASFPDESRLINIINSQSIKMSTFHIERCPFEYMFYISGSKAITIDNVFTKFDRRDGVIIVNSQSVSINHFSSEDNVIATFADIRINDINCTDISYDKFQLTQVTTLVARKPVINSVNFPASITAQTSYNKYVVGTDADITITPGTSIILPTITANRTLTIDKTVPNDISKPIVIYCRNTNDAFFWSVSPVMTDQDGQNFSRLKNNSTVTALVSNNSNLRMTDESQVLTRFVTDFHTLGTARRGKVASIIQNPANAALPNLFGEGDMGYVGNDANYMYLSNILFGKDFYNMIMTAGVWGSWTKSITDANIQTVTSGGLLTPAITGVNAKNTGATTLYTPSGNKAIITSILFVCTAATSITSAPIIDVGSLAAGDIVLNTELVGFNAFKEVYNIQIQGTSIYVDSGTPIMLNINTGAVGTSMTMDVYLYGTLI